MCGILCEYVHSSNCSRFKRDTRLLELLKRRGPDTFSDLTLYTTTSGEIVDEQSSADDIDRGKLYLCGCTLWMQGNSPEKQPLNSENGTLLYNGDLFDTGWSYSSSDTRAIFERLDFHPDKNENNRFEYIFSVLKTLRGPFSIIYLDKFTKRLYFCRDQIGRRSLLVHKNDQNIIISSVLSRIYEPAFELPVGKIFSLCLKTIEITEYSWNKGSEEASMPFADWFDSSNCKNDSVMKNILEIPSCITTPEDLQFLNELENTAKTFQDNTLFLKKMLEIQYIANIVDKLYGFLSESVKHRISTQPKICIECPKSHKCEKHSTVGILFSGGLDCTIIAALVHQHLPFNESIDLLNVAFSKKGDTFETPDRITSRQSFEELCKLFPQRDWNLVEINVTQEELYDKQREVIADLIYPLKTILDESLGSALWFAARGKSSTYISPCRIVLTGIGADELFGGYMRHRNEFRRHGWASLEKELQFDWQRIASRNLARDDRVISFHGRQPRMPYLDESFVDFVLSLKPWQKCFPSDACKAGTGDKMLLRLLAVKIGLCQVATFSKRAIQFGSKIANKNESATDISKRLLL